MTNEISDCEASLFERALLTFCGAEELDARARLTRELTDAGFRIRYDDYRSAPQPRSPQRAITSMLAVRGAPATCLVAHTDVVRDWAKRDGRVEPVLRFEEATGRRIISDRAGVTQAGGDDRVGVVIARELALNTRSNLALLLTTDEEIGLRGAEAVPAPWLLPFELLVQIDRGSAGGRELVTSIHGLPLCSPEWEARLLEIASAIGLPRRAVNGLSTDVYALARRGVSRNAVNLSCGYFDGHLPTEWIDVREAEDTLQYVSAIVRAERRQ